ncbi:MAG: host attachment protein [Alphaproteobacteria bacterium]|nr:host attachment protein [Alphaproteobacteria bacterium]
MLRTRVPHGAFVLVSDGAKALLLCNRGDGAHLDLSVVDQRQEDHPRTSEQGTDRPGRTHSSVGPGRSGYEQTDWHRMDEDRFLQAVLSRLDGLVGEDGAPGLVVVAPARALGELRKHYSTRLSRALLAEVEKDLTNHPVSEIERLISG